ncbi:trypsin-like peptidase domain-containing protein [Streptomyces sp. MUSC 14]|uniref:trypsin-like peptidase domain-containing protein n=1 Tax=Streptomyces sp. MUSC 14 TaxID=1354889 RepID=UPI000ADBB8E8|nr:trypsin-like peptidase domain-containing protein [Streptomyces sp. MUSC 14]
MAGRGPRTGCGRGEAGDRRREPGDGIGRTPAPPPPASHVPGLVQIRDLAGRPRGVGFLADHDGTLLTSHEAVDGLPRLVLRATADTGAGDGAGDGRGAGERVCVVDAAAVTPLPAQNLALVRTQGLGTAPLPLTVRERIDAGTYVRLPAGCWREARVLAATEATYTATDRCHPVPEALELAIGTAGRDALRLGCGAAGGPVLDPCTGAVLGVLGTALHTGQRDAAFAVPLRPAADGPLGELLARNAATVPAYGADLNLGGVLELTATSVGQDGPPARLADGPEPVERYGVARELAAFADGDRAVLALVGAAGSGRTTELAALAARRARTDRPAPTLWLRGADLADADGSVADAARRTLERAARIVAAARCAPSGGLGDVTPERLARLAARAGRPLLLLVDGPEEMPPVLAHRQPEWIRGTADWLRETGARLVVACREEYWERAGALFPPDQLYAPADPAAPTAPTARVTGPAAPLAAAAPAAGRVPSAAPAPPVVPAPQTFTATPPCPPGPPPPPLPPCVRLAALTSDEARRARARYGVPDGVLGGRDARHPLVLRLLAEIRAAVPDAPAAARSVGRHEVFAAHLDLMCLRIALRLAAASGDLRGTAVRRLAARVAGQVHEAARRSLGPGQGELDRESFEAVFPWGPAPARLGGGTGWASAVLAEGLLVPAGTGYRFAHGEVADWIQGMHLDLDEALHALVHRPRATGERAPVPVPHHRAGPVVQALLLLAQQCGPRQLAARLRDLTDALDRDPASWWAARLLAHTLHQVPDATPYTEVLRLLAERIVAWRRARRTVPAEFGPAFWTGLPLPDAERLDLLRRLVLADQATPGPGGRYLDAVARLLAAAPAVVQPELIRWFADERPLPATPHATVATAAQALLHTHRHGALDDLIDLLAGSPHRRADELLGTLAEDEPAALCRAVDRWAHDERAVRRATAVAFGLRTAPHAHAEADRALLRLAALALLARPADRFLHGGALALLVHDPHTRDSYLPAALRHFADGDPHVPPGALAPALTTHPEPVLEAFRTRLGASDAPDAARLLAALADAATPALARAVAALARDAVRQRPEGAGHLAGQLAHHVDRRFEQQGPTARPVLLPLVTGLLDGGPEPLRAALAAVLAAPGTPACHPLRRELLEILLAGEQEPSVLTAVLHAAAAHGDRREEEMRGLVHRTGLLLVRTPEGATRFDRGLVDLGRHVPGFALLMARWLSAAPDDWAAVVGPSTRRTLESLAGVRVPA